MLALRYRLWVSAKERKAFTTLSGKTVLILAMHNGSHAVDFQKSDVASQFTDPSESSSHYDSTTPVINDKVLIFSLSPASSDVCVSDPPDCQEDLICFMFNNLSPCNLPSMVAEFLESVAHAHLPWVAT